MGFAAAAEGGDLEVGPRWGGLEDGWGKGCSYMPHQRGMSR